MSGLIMCERWVSIRCFRSRKCNWIIEEKRCFETVEHRKRLFLGMI